MKKEIKKINDSKIEILVELSWLEFQPYLKKFSQERNPFQKSAQEVIQQTYLKLIKEEGIEPISLPRAEILKIGYKNPFLFRIELEILPEIQLPDYRKIASKVEKEKIEVSEREILETLRYLQRSRVKFRNLSRGAEKGDFVEIEYKSDQIGGGKVFKDRFLLGKGHFVKGFEENLQGLKEGQEKEFEILFPNNYFQRKLAGQKVVFKVKMKKVQQMEIPELSDDFARTLGNFNSLDDLKKNIKEGLIEEKTIIARERRREKILETISKEINWPTLPETLVSLEKERIFQEFKEMIEKRTNLSFEEYLKKIKIKKTTDQLKEDFEKEAKKQVRRFLLIREIGKQEEVKVTDEEVKERANKILARFPNKELAQKEISPQKLRNFCYNLIFEEKVLKKIEEF